MKKYVNYVTNPTIYYNNLEMWNYYASGWNSRFMLGYSKRYKYRSFGNCEENTRSITDKQLKALFSTGRAV